ERDASRVQVRRDVVAPGARHVLRPAEERQRPGRPLARKRGGRGEQQRKQRPQATRSHEWSPIGATLANRPCAGARGRYAVSLVGRSSVVNSTRPGARRVAMGNMIPSRSFIRSTFRDPRRGDATVSCRVRAVFTSAAGWGIVLAAAAAGVAGAASGPPPAARKPVENRYFGATARDDYQWMEDWSDSATRAWVGAENAYTRGILDRIPSRAAIRDRVAELTRSISPDYNSLVYRGGVLFALKDQPPRNQPMLVARSSVDDAAHESVLFDPNAVDSTGSLTIDFFVPSQDHSKVALSLSRGGTESGDLHVLDVASGHELGDVLP